VLVALPGSVLETWLRRGRTTAAIVRPDRTVMRAGHDVAALCAWTATVLHDGRATITGVRTECKTALLTEPSTMPVNPPLP
jgi:hypothetical protein